MDELVATLLSNVVIAGALAIVAAAITKLWRNPHLAHAMWLLVLVKLVTPPVWHLPLRLLPARQPIAALDKASGTAISADGMADDIVWIGPWGEATDGLDVSYGGMPATHLAVPDLAEAESAAPATTLPVRESPDRFESGVAAFARDYWPEAAVSAWIIGLLVVIATTIRGYRRFAAVVSRSVLGGPELIRDVRRFAAAMGLSRVPGVRISDEHVAPLVSTFGWPPLILLPGRLLDGLDLESRRAILVHELAHLRRRDHWVRWFEFLVLGLHWWNPVAWCASWMLRAAAEECCDAWVIWVLPNGRRSYGRALLRTVEFLTERGAVSAAAGTAFGGFAFRRRIEMIMKQNLNRQMSWTVAGFLVFLALVVLPVAGQTGSRDDRKGDPNVPAETQNLPPLNVATPQLPAGSDESILEGSTDWRVPLNATNLPAAKNLVNDSGTANVARTQSAADGDIESRMRRLERTVDELARLLKDKAAATDATAAAKPGSTESAALEAFNRGFAISNRLASQIANARSAQSADDRMVRVFDNNAIGLITPGESKSELVLFDATSGRIRWKAQLNGHASGFVTSKIANAVAVQLGDKTQIFDVSTGKLAESTAVADYRSILAKQPDQTLQVIHLSHAKATEAYETLTRLFPKIFSAVDARTNSLIIRASDEQFAEICEMLKKLDETRD